MYSLRGLLLALLLASSAASLSAGPPAMTPELPPSASGGGERSSGSETPTSPSSGSELLEPRSPIEAFENLEAEWQEFTKAWDAFYPMLETLGIGLSELPDYLSNLEKSLELERIAREAEMAALEVDAAAARQERDEAMAESKRLKVFAWILAAAGASGWLAFAIGR